MGWFRRKRKPDAPRLDLPRPALTVLLKSLPRIDQQAVSRTLEAFEPLRLSPTFDMLEPDLAHEGQIEYGHIEFDSHRIKLAGFNTPVPDSVTFTTIDVTPLPASDRDAMKAHGAHMLLWSESGGKETLDRYLALYKLAVALAGDELCGVAVEAACTALPAAVIPELLSPDMLESMRETVPPLMFTGTVRLRSRDETEWLVTKGYHVFGVPDLVMRLEADEPVREVGELFHTILNYAVRTGKRLAAGHTMQQDEEVFLRLSEFTPPSNEDEFLLGAKDTLEIKRITKEEINR